MKVDSLPPPVRHHAAAPPTRVISIHVLAMVCVGVTLDAQQAVAPLPSAPVVVLAATSDEASVTFRLTDVDTLTPQDLSLGALTNAATPNHHIVPELRKVDVSGAPKDWTVSLTVGNIIHFGETTVPALVRGEAKRLLRFQKPGLMARASSGSSFEVREGQHLIVVVENPTTFAYDRVRARMRFQQTEICSAVVDAPAAGGTPETAPNCEDPATWVAFRIDRHAPVTFRFTPPAEWFLDAQTGFPRGARRSGVLTLRYTGQGATPAVFEQALPLDVQFNPGDRSILKNLFWIAGLLLMGALLALALRVAIPNYRRKESLKEQLGDAQEATRDIHFETMLRVLLKVEGLTLDQLRRRSWILGPSFLDIAQRTEDALAILKRKIELTRRLDTARGRKLTLQGHDVPPTRLDLIDRHLDATCGILLREQLVEQDWVFAQQRLEAADKLLAEPTIEEKDAFHAFLVQRWKSIVEFFTLDGRKPKIPDSLAELREALPHEDALPAKDSDGSNWVHAIGPARADLQISALEILRDFVFLAPALSSEERSRVASMLSTPSLTELHDTRLLIREFSEGVRVEDVLKALKAGEADIEMTPRSVRPNEKAHLALRFRNPRFDTAAARLSIRCEWTIIPVGRSAANPVQVSAGQPPASVPPVSPPTRSVVRRLLSWLRLKWRQPRAEGTTVEDAYGWEIYHCFFDATGDWLVTTHFFYDGAPVTNGADGLVEFTKNVPIRPRSQDWGNRVERVVPEAAQLGAALLVPLATLAVTQSAEGTSGRWWELVGVGFGSEMIRSILTGKPDQSP